MKPTLLILATLLAATGWAAEPSTTEKNRALLKTYHEEVWEKGNPAFAKNVMGPGFTSHAQPPVLPREIAARPVSPADLRKAFPDLKSHADAILADGDKVVVLWTMTGTHDGELLGIAPTHRAIAVQGMDVLRVENGKFVEHWGGYNDQLGRVVRQLTEDKPR